MSRSMIRTLRRTSRRTLIDRCAIHRKTMVSDGGGGEVETWQTIASDVPCRIRPIGGGETNEDTTAGGRIMDETTHLLALPAGQDIEHEDRVTVDGVVYDVTLVRRMGGWEIERRVELRETPGGGS